MQRDSGAAGSSCKRKLWLAHQMLAMLLIAIDSEVISRNRCLIVLLQSVAVRHRLVVHERGRCDCSLYTRNRCNFLHGRSARKPTECFARGKRCTSMSTTLQQ